MALDDAHPEQSWEVSHIGGDRFAGNMVVLPEGLYYGRLDPAAGLAVARSHLAGELDLERLRGRSSYPMPVQAAEIHLRRELGVTGVRAATLVAARRAAQVTEATFEVAGERYAVRVRTVLEEATATRLTCKARRDNPVPRHEILSVRRG